MLLWRYPKSQKLYEGTFINIQRAPEPFEIIWEHYEDKVIQLRRVLTGLCTGLMMLFCAMVVYFVSVYKKNLKHYTHYELSETELVLHFLIQIVPLVTVFVGIN